MKKAALMIVLTVGLGSILLAQQKYPNMSTPPVILENDDIIVQKIEFMSGAWAGEHSHEKKHLAVALDDIRMIFREDGKEREVVLKKGDVIWSDPVESHDHMPMDSGTALLITLK